MKNPVRKFKEEKDLTVAELAVLADVAPTTAWKSMTGENQTLNDNIVSTMEAEGYDPDQLREDYQAYREAKRKELVAG